MDCKVIYLGLWWEGGDKADFKDEKPVVGGREVTLNMVDIERGSEEMKVEQRLMQ